MPDQRLPPVAQLAAAWMPNSWKRVGRNNRKANYYRVVGSDRGAYKLKGRWIGVREFNRHLELQPQPLIRWQGPPSRAIVAALTEPSL